MDRRSRHLSSEERGVISAEHNRGSSQRSIGALPGAIGNQQFPQSYLASKTPLRAMKHGHELKPELFKNSHIIFWNVTITDN